MGRGSRALSPPLQALLQGPVLFLEPVVGKGSLAGLGWVGLFGLAFPCLCGGRHRLARGLPLWAPVPERWWVCGQGWSCKGGGHPASLSLAQLHFQKFLPPVRKGKKNLGSLSGCRGGGSQVGTRFPRLELRGFRLGQSVGFGTEAGSQPEVSEELTSGTGGACAHVLPGYVCGCRRKT